MKCSLIYQDCSDMLPLFLLYDGPSFSEGKIGRDVIPIPVKPDMRASRNLHCYPGQGIGLEKDS